MRSMPGGEVAVFRCCAVFEDQGVLESPESKLCVPIAFYLCQLASPLTTKITEVVRIHLLSLLMIQVRRIRDAQEFLTMASRLTGQ